MNWLRKLFSKQQAGQRNTAPPQAVRRDPILPYTDLAAFTLTDTQQKNGMSYSTRDAYVLDCRIETGAHLFYEIQPDGSVQHIAEPVPGVRLVSAVYAAPGRADDDTADDYRFNLPKKMTASQASSYIQREMGLFQKLRSVVESGSGLTAWAVVEDKVIQKGRVLPFAWVLEQLMASDNLIAPCVTGVLFGEANLLILMAFPGNGRAFVQTSVSPDNLAEIITSFAAINSINVDIETVPIYTGKEFIAVLGRTPPYPIDTDVMGVPMPVVARSVFSVSVLMLVSALATYAYLAMQTQRFNNTIATINQHSQQVTQASLTRFQSNPDGLARAMSVDYLTLLQDANALWVTGSRVESHADAATETYLLVLPLHSKINNVTQMQLHNMLHPAHVPRFCQLIDYSLTSSTSELHARYHCEHGGDVLADMEQQDTGQAGGVR